MTLAERQKRVQVWMNRISKWKTIYCGWQLGTRSADDPEAQAVRDMVERSLIMRVELNALISALIGNDPEKRDAFMDHFVREADLFNKSLEERWPGATSTDSGMNIDIRAAPWLIKFKP